LLVMTASDRWEAGMAPFYAWLAAHKSGKIKLAVMDMWRSFRNAPGIKRRKRRSCTTSSTSCAISARRSTRYGLAGEQGGSLHFWSRGDVGKGAWARIARATFELAEIRSVHFGPASKLYLRQAPVEAAVGRCWLQQFF
jgi:hypothetical protein